MWYNIAMNKFQQRRAERRGKIVAEAKKLILERGISDGLMSELAPLAGISRQQLYSYYKNTDALLGDIMGSVQENSYLIRIADAPDVDSPENIIRYSILSFKNLSEEAHDDLLFLLLYGVYRATNKDADKFNSRAQVMLFEKQILQGQQAGIFRTDKPLEELTAAVSHILAGYTSYSETLSEEGRRQMLSDELLNLLADMVLAYLKGKCN